MPKNKKKQFWLDKINKIYLISIKSTHFVWYSLNMVFIVLFVYLFATDGTLIHFCSQLFGYAFFKQICAKCIYKCTKRRYQTFETQLYKFMHIKNTHCLGTINYHKVFVTEHLLQNILTLSWHDVYIVNCKLIV